MEGGGELGLGVTDGRTIVEAKLQMDVGQCRLSPVWMQRLQQGYCCAVAAEDGEWLGVIDPMFFAEAAFRQGAPIHDRDSIAQTSEAVGGSKTGGASAKDRDGLGVSGCHENRERSQTPAARASR